MANIPRVCIVDRDPDARYRVQGLVQQAGFSVAGQAGLGTEAVALAQELKPDIVLCGAREPMARTVQTVESLVHVLPETPVIVYSESSDLETIRQLMLAGARDFIKAPFSPSELRQSLTAALESEERRRLRDTGAGALGPEGVVITVFGAKGGVGKTTIATNLAVAIARTGQATLLMDTDDTFGDAAPALALTAEYAVTDAIAEQDAASSDAARKLFVQHDSGLNVLAAPANPFAWKGVAGERLQRLIEASARRLDIVVIDTGSTLSDVTLAGLRAASIILWVTTPDYASVRDSLQALQVVRSLNIPDDRIRIILNVSSPEIDVSPAAIEQAMGTPIFWTIPYDRALRRSGQVGQAAVDASPLSPAAHNLVDLARVLTGGPLEAEEARPRRRLFGGLRLRRDKGTRLEVSEEVTP